MVSQTKTLAILLILGISVQLSLSQTIQCDYSDANYVNMADFPLYQQDSELLVDGELCSYAGYIENDSNQFFHWYFPSTSKLTLSQIPVVVFINGAPGQSTLNPLFSEFGPLQFKQNEDDGESLYVTDRIASWTRFMSVVYVEIQTQVGFNIGDASYDIQSMGKTLSSILETLQQKFEGQNVVLYSRDFGAKIALEASENIDVLIFDNPLIDTITSKTSISPGAVGTGVFGLENLNIMETQEILCTNNAYNATENTIQYCDKNIREFLTANSGLDPSDIRHTIINPITQGMENLNSFMNQNLDDLVSVLHLKGFTGPFSSVNEDTYSELSNQYGLNYTSQLQSAMQKATVSILYGEFNIANGPLSGEITLMNTLGLNIYSFPEKNLYSTGIQVAGGIGSGQKQGYFYTLHEFDQQQNFFVVNQGAYMNTWLEQSTELVYNMATANPQFCYTYNQRECTMNYGRQQLMNNCSGNGEYNEQIGICECNKGFALADCSKAVPEIDLSNSDDEDDVLVSIGYLHPREWAFFSIKADEKDDINLIQIQATRSLNDGSKTGAELEIYVSDQEIVIDSWNSNFLGAGYQVAARENLEGQYNIIISKNKRYYVSIRNTNFWEGAETKISSFVEIGESFWQSGKGGYVLNIVLFSFAMVFFVAGAFFFGQGYAAMKKNQ